MLTKSCLNNIHSCFCLRPKAKELGIAQVVVFLVVGFFVSKTHATPLSLYFYFFFLFILSITISIYHYIIHVYLPRPTYLPTYTNLCQPTYPYQHTYLPISTHLPRYLCLLTNTYQPMSSYHYLPTYLYQSLKINMKSPQTQEPVSVLFKMVIV